MAWNGETGRTEIFLGPNSPLREPWSMFVLFQNDRCVASAETVIVLMDVATRRLRPLPPETVERFSALGGAAA